MTSGRKPKGHLLLIRGEGCSIPRHSYRWHKTVLVILLSLLPNGILWLKAADLGIMHLMTTWLPWIGAFLWLESTSPQWRKVSKNMGRLFLSVPVVSSLMTFALDMITFH